MTERGDWLADYAPVDERIADFYRDHPDGTLTAEYVPELSSDTRICMRAYADRGDGSRYGVGHSWLEIPGPTAFTRGSEIENAETSAWGRALAAIGYTSKRGVASREEIATKQPARGPEGVPAVGSGPPPVSAGAVPRGARRASPASYPSAERMPPPPRTAAEEALISELLALPGMTYARLQLMADQAGVPKGTHATEAQLRAMLTIAGWPLPEPHAGAAVVSPPTPAPAPDKVPA